MEFATPLEFPNPTALFRVPEPAKIARMISVVYLKVLSIAPMKPPSRGHQVSVATYNLPYSLRISSTFQSTIGAGTAGLANK